MVVYRKARRKDLAAFYQIYLQVFPKDSHEDKPMPKSALFIKERIPFVASDSDEILGIVFAEQYYNSQNEILLSCLGVRDEQRGKGVGRRLVLKVESWARQNGYSAVILQCSPEMVSYYEKLGYQKRWQGNLGEVWLFEMEKLVFKTDRQIEKIMFETFGVDCGQYLAEGLGENSI